MSFFMLDKSHERASDVVTRFVWMTPDLARYVLEQHNTRNRTMKERFVKRLTRDIQRGDWKPHHQGIAFAADGTLLDGQNRLKAIAEAGIPVLLMVSYNVTPNAQAYMDNGTKRNDAERQRFGFDLDVDRHDTAIARAMLGRGVEVDVSDAELSGFLGDHLEAIRFARSAWAMRWGGSYAALYAVLARAYYHVEGTRLVRFCRVMHLDPYEAHESAAALWGKMITKRGLGPRFVFECTQRALGSFLQGVSKGNIKPESRNLFPLPGEDEDEAFAGSRASLPPAIPVGLPLVGLTPMQQPATLQ